MSDDVRSRWDRWVALGYALYTLGNLYPYSDPRRMGHIVPAWGDPLFDLWQLRWFGHQVFRDPLHLWDANVFYPLRQAMRFNDTLFGLALLAAPVGHLTGNWVLARNVLLVLGFFLSAWFTYRLARRLGAHPSGAFLAGLLYGFCSFRFHHLTNLKLSFGPLIPLFFYSWTDFIQTGRPLALTAAVGVGLFQMLSSMYYGFFLLTLAPLYGLVLWATGPRVPRPPVRPGAWALAVGGIGLATLGMVLGFLGPYKVVSDWLGLRHSIEANVPWAADPTSYLATQSRVGFAWTARWWNAERVLWPGSLALCALGALPGRRTYAMSLWVLTVVSFLLSLGPRTPVFRGFYHALPYFPAMRYPARWGLMAVFGLALLSALGVTRLWKRVPSRYRWGVLGILTAVAAVDLWHAPLPATPVPDPPPVYRHLQASSEPGAVAVFPLYSDFRQGSTFYGYWTTFHWKPVIGAYAAWTPPSFEWIRLVLNDFPLPHALWLAQYLNVRYLVFHPESFRRVGAPDQWERYRRLMATALPPEWVLRQKQELEDVLLVLNLERIRQDISVRPPSRWTWQSPRPEQVRTPALPAARRAMTDGDPDTAWVVEYTDDWHVTVDFGRPVTLQALRVFTDPKDKILYLWGSSDGSTWRPVSTVPWWVWAGAHALPEARTYPDPERWRDRPVLLCAPNRVRYLKLTTSPVAGRIAVRELQVLLQDEE